MGLQTASLIGQLVDHGVPTGEALVTAFADGELTLVASCTFITARTRNTLHTGALTCGTMALVAGDSPGVTVARWENRIKNRKNI